MDTEPIPAPNTARSLASPVKQGGCLGKLMLMLISTVLTLVVVEGAVRLNERRIYENAGIFVPADPTMDGVAWEIPGEDPERFRFQADGDSLVHVKSSNPALVYEMRPNITISAGISTNPQGFRDQPFSREKAPGEYRIAAVGDSITFGWAMEEGGEVYVRKLERKLNDAAAPGTRFTLYNFGVGGYNAAQELALIKAKVLDYRPDLILMGYCGNDDQIGYDGGLWRHFTRTWWRTWDFALLRWLLFLERMAALDLVERSYAELAGITREAGVPVLVALFPFTNDPEGTALEAREAYFRGLGLDVVNLYPLFNARGLESLMTDMVHPNAEGHALAAEALFEVLAGPEPPTPPGLAARP